MRYMSPPLLCAVEPPSSHWRPPGTRLPNDNRRLPCRVSREGAQSNSALSVTCHSRQPRAAVTAVPVGGAVGALWTIGATNVWRCLLPVVTWPRYRLAATLPTSMASTRPLPLHGYSAEGRTRAWSVRRTRSLRDAAVRRRLSAAVQTEVRASRHRRPDRAAAAFRDEVMLNFSVAREGAFDGAATVC